MTSDAIRRLWIPGLAHAGPWECYIGEPWECYIGDQSEKPGRCRSTTRGLAHAGPWNASCYTQRARCRARPPSSLRRCHERALLRKTRNARSIPKRGKFFTRRGVTLQSSMHNGDWTSRGGDPSAVPVAHAECVPCKAEERREASRAVTRFFRIV